MLATCFFRRSLEVRVPLQGSLRREEPVQKGSQRLWDMDGVGAGSVKLPCLCTLGRAESSSIHVLQAVRLQLTSVCDKTLQGFRSNVFDIGL